MNPYFGCYDFSDFLLLVICRYFPLRPDCITFPFLTVFLVRFNQTA